MEKMRNFLRDIPYIGNFGRPVRRLLGGKWGRVTGLIWGKNWISLGRHAAMFDEFHA